MNLLALNAGSSSLKFRFLGMDAAQEQPLASGSVKGVEQVFDACASFRVDATAHRVVHGGPRLFDPTLITTEVLEAIRSAAQLAPLHNDAALAGIEAAMKRFPAAPAVAVFDTGFHQSIPEIAWRYALPRELADRHGLRRYGFHGISHRYVSQRLLEHLRMPATGSRLITLHLGSGCSVCAVRDGRSIDTSMGFTPMEGLVMGTRCGDVDPGVLLHLLNRLNMPVSELDDVLNQRSGLLGLWGRSGVPADQSAGSPDVREIEHAAEMGDFAAEQALEIFAYHVRKYIGAYAVALGGLDALAFCGGIGEHAAAMRSRICRGLEFLGIDLDLVRNSATGDAPQRISADAADVQVCVIPTDEQTQIAREAMSVLRQEG